MKKLVVSLLCVMMITSFMPSMAFATDEEAAGEIVYLDGNAVDNGDGTKENPYNTFKAAMDVVNDGGTIELLNDYSKESITFDAGTQNLVQITKNISLELNDHKIYATGSYGWYGLSVSAGVSATVQNGEIICNRPSTAALTVANGGVANIVNCMVKAETNNKPAVNLDDDGTLIGTKSTFVGASNASGVYVSNLDSAKEIHLTDCTVSADKDAISVVSGNMHFDNCDITVPSGKDAYFLTVENGSTAVISDGTITGNVKAGWESNGFVKIQKDTLVNGQVVHAGNGTNNVASRIELAGGKYALTENLISVNEKIKDNITVSGGLFKNEAVIKDFVKEPYKIIANTGTDSIEYPYTIQNIPEGTVACVGNNTYTSLEDAMEAAGERETILLVANVETDALSGNINGNGKTITYKGTLSTLAKSDVTLTNSNVKCTDADISNIALSGGKLTGGVVNSGDVDDLLAENYFVTHDTKKIDNVSAFAATIGKSGYTAIINATTVAARTPEKETIVLRKNSESRLEEVIPNANYILDLNGYTINEFFIVSSATGGSVPNNADITIIDSSEAKTGKIVSEDNFAVGINGTLENIKLTLDGITVESKAVAGIYFPSSGKLTIKDSKITGTTGVELRGGELEIDNSEITATAEEFKETPNDRGSTIEGAAIAISQHTTNHEINVNIKSGIFKGIKALYEKDLQDDSNNNIQMVVTGGDFDGPVESDNVENFIEGGTFTEWPGEELVADKTLAVQKDDSIHIGDEAGEIITAVQPGDKITVLVTGGKDLVIPEGVIVENNSGEDITINGEEVAPGEEITTKEPVYVPSTPTPTVQKPVIEAEEGAAVTLSKDGTTATIVIDKDATLKDVLLNGKSLGAVTEVQNLKTGDKLVVVVETLAEKNARLKAGVENTTIKLKSALGKGHVRLDWNKSEGYKVDNYQVFRSTKRYSGYGTKAYFETTKGGLKGWYKNTKQLKKGTRYYYKVRGVREIAGEAVYTQWSNKAWRLVK